MKYCFALMLALLTCSLATAQNIIDTFPQWDGVSNIGSWGGGGGTTPTYGQSFTADATHSTLTNLTFPFSGNGQAQNYLAYVYQWSGSDTIGSALFTSSVLSYNGASGFQSLSVPTGTVALTPGLQYVAFFSTIGQTGSTAATIGLLGAVNEPSGNFGADGYIGGNFVYNNNTGGFSGGWSDPSAYGGQASFYSSFTLAFAAVPEPTTWALIGVGTLGTGVYAWRKKRLAVRAGMAKLKK